MKRVSWSDVLSFIALAAMTMMMVWMVVRDIDKDVERDCGYTRFEGAPEWCESWWKDKGVMDANAPMQESASNADAMNETQRLTRNERSNETAHDMQR